MKKIFTTLLFIAGFCSAAWAGLDNSGFEAHTYMHDGHIPDGIYEIVSIDNTNLCWDVTGGSTDDGAEIQLYTRNGSAAQQFEIKMVKEVAASYNGTNYIHYFYTIKNVHSGKYVDLAGGSLDNATKIHQWSGSGGTSSANQMWEFDIIGSAVFWIKAYKNDEAWQPRITSGVVTGGTPTYTQGSKLKTTYYNSSTKWTLIPVDGKKITRIDPAATYRISFKTDPAKGLDVSGTSTDDGANIHLWTYGGGNNQKWKFEYITEGEYANKGYYYIKAVHSGKYIHAANGSLDGNPNVHQWEGTGKNASWMIRETDEEGFFNFINASGRVMDSFSNQTGDGNNIQGHRINASNAQKFEIVEVVDADENVPLVVDGLYSIRPAGNKAIALDVSSASTENGANIMLYEYSECSKNQQWIIEHLGYGYHTIKAHHSKKALEIAGGVSAKGTNVQQYAYNGSDAQKWHFRVAKIENGKKYYYIVNSLGLYLDDSGGKLLSGDNVQIWTPNYGNAQIWEIEPCVVSKEITDAQYATMWYPDLDLQLPEDFEAFSYTLNAEETNVVQAKKYSAGDRIPKGEGVVVHYIPETVEDGQRRAFAFPVLQDKASDDPVTANNCLKSSHGNIDVNAAEGQYVYRLIKGSKGVGFYMTRENAEKGTAEGKYLNSKSHLCYLFAKYKAGVMTKAAPEFISLTE